MQKYLEPLQNKEEQKIEEIFSKVIAIILGCILMFLVPMGIVSERQKNMEQTYILTETICFVDSICNKGIIYSDVYLNFVEKIQQEDEIYNINLEHIKSSNHEEIKFNNYTKQILNVLENEGNYKFEKDDFFRIEITDSDDKLVLFYGGCIKDEDY